MFVGAAPTLSTCVVGVVEAFAVNNSIGEPIIEEVVDAEEDDVVL